MTEAVITALENEIQRERDMAPLADRYAAMLASSPPRPVRALAR